jgi:hypothetical protein
MLTAGGIPTEGPAVSPGCVILACSLHHRTHQGRRVNTGGAMADPFALNDDGTSKDPAAFRESLRADPIKMEALEKEPEVAAIVLGEDVNAFQELIKSVYQVRTARVGAGKVPVRRRGLCAAGGPRGGQEGDGPLAPARCRLPPPAGLSGSPPIAVSPPIRHHCILSCLGT